MGTIQTVKLRNLEIGAGVPKVIVPIVAPTAEGILEKAREIMNHTFDFLEWRADFYEDVLNTGKVLSTLKALRAVMGEKPILVTVRTKEEGGAAELDANAYTALNTAIAQSGDADIIDVQIFLGDEVARENIDAIHAAGCKVIGSYHNFDGTPDKETLLQRMRKAQEMGADILKAAVMPKGPADVLALLDATQEMHAKYADRPLITMSMGDGVISRLSGECFGSAATFGMIGQASAPGQIPTEQLSTVLSILHQALSPQG